MVTPSTRDPETYAIIGAAMSIHTELGCGYLEAVYKAALSIELTDRSIPFLSEVPLPIFYKTRRLPLGYRVDFVCFDSVLIEVKALPSLGAIEAAQALNYLRASGRQRGLILNFGAASLQYRRIVWDTARGAAGSTGRPLPRPAHEGPTP